MYPIEMVPIPGGSFRMGSPANEVDDPCYTSDECSQRTITLSDFYMGKYQITQDQYNAVMETNPSYNSSEPAAGEIQENRPGEEIRWYDAIVFCNKLSMAEGLSPAYKILNKTNPADWGNVPY